MRGSPKMKFSHLKAQDEERRPDTGSYFSCSGKEFLMPTQSTKLLIARLLSIRRWACTVQVRCCPCWREMMNAEGAWATMRPFKSTAWSWPKPLWGASVVLCSAAAPQSWLSVANEQKKDGTRCRTAGFPEGRNPQMVATVRPVSYAQVGLPQMELATPVSTGGGLSQREARRCD